jgi:outer membrane porin, OprD family
MKIRELINFWHYKIFLIIIFSMPFTLYAAGASYILDEEPHPASADEITGPLSNTFVEERPETPFFPILKKILRELPPFFRDTRLGMNFRTYDFDRNNKGFIDPDGSNDNKAWAIGGALDYKSGLFADRFAIGATYFTTQKIRGEENEGGTLLLAPEQTGFGVLGQSYVQIKLAEEINFQGYRQYIDTPYLNKQDSRMVPNTFEAYKIEATNILRNIDYTFGYVNKIKKRNSDSFKSMSSVAGATGTDDGLFMAGARYEINDKTNFGAINHYSFNVMNILYAEFNHFFDISDQIPVKFSAQFTDQRSVGSEYIGDFDTRTGGISTSISYKGFVFTLAGTITDDNSSIRSPYGGRPSYLSLAIEDFDRADEDAWLVGLAYDFSLIGIDGLSVYTNYAEGYTPDTGSAASPDQTEWDFTVDYRPDFIPLKGLWFRYRYAEVDRDGPGAIDKVDNRLILNWEIPLI